MPEMLSWICHIFVPETFDFLEVWLEGPWSLQSPLVPKERAGSGIRAPIPPPPPHTKKRQTSERENIGAPMLEVVAGGI